MSSKKFLTLVLLGLFLSFAFVSSANLHSPAATVDERHFKVEGDVVADKDATPRAVYTSLAPLAEVMIVLNTLSRCLLARLK